jgi:anaerobic magnesium-protoporphyrin IX monomethyl ester cyclase
VAVPSAVTCSGGVHVTADPLGALNGLGVDFVVTGEGEFVMREACERISAGGGLEGIKGIVFKRDGRVVDNGRREPISDLDSLPEPARHLIDYERRYLVFPGVIRGQWVRSTIVVVGRGCPFNCIYCGVQTVFGRACRMRSVENVMSEIEHLIERYRIKGLFFNDSLFTFREEWVSDLCREIRKRNIKLTWGCNSRVDTISEPILRDMKSAGCVRVDYGVESGSERILKVLHKGITPDQVVRAFDLTRKVGMKSGASFMIGNPCETMDDIIQTERLAKRIRSNYTVFFYTTPFPGTELYSMAAQNGWISAEPEFSDKWAFRESDLPAMTINFTEKEMQAMRARLQNVFFLRNYLHWENARVILTVLWIAATNIRVTLGIIRNFFKTGRLDSIAEHLLIGYRRKILSGNKPVEKRSVLSHDAYRAECA